MSILVNSSTRVITQGMTGKTGTAFRSTARLPRLKLPPAPMRP